MWWYEREMRLQGLGRFQAHYVLWLDFFATYPRFVGGVPLIAGGVWCALGGVLNEHVGFVIAAAVLFLPGVVLWAWAWRRSDQPDDEYLEHLTEP